VTSFEANAQNVYEYKGQSKPDEDYGSGRKNGNLITAMLCIFQSSVFVMHDI